MGAGAHSVTSMVPSCTKGQKIILRPTKVFHAKLAPKGQKRAKKPNQKLRPRAIKKGQVREIYYDLSGSFQDVKSFSVCTL